MVEEREIQVSKSPYDVWQRRQTMLVTIFSNNENGNNNPNSNDNNNNSDNNNNDKNNNNDNNHNRTTTKTQQR